MRCDVHEPSRRRGPDLRSPILLWHAKASSLHSGPHPQLPCPSPREPRLLNLPIQTPKRQAVQCRALQQTPFLDPLKLRVHFDISQLWFRPCGHPKGKSSQVWCPTSPQVLPREAQPITGDQGDTGCTRIPPECKSDVKRNVTVQADGPKNQNQGCAQQDVQTLSWLPSSSFCLLLLSQTVSQKAHVASKTPDPFLVIAHASKTTSGHFEGEARHPCGGLMKE